MIFRKDWNKEFVESPLAGSIGFDPGASQVRVFDGRPWIFTASTKQEEDYQPETFDKMMQVLKPKKYPTICPHCGAPHNPNEARCEYCDGYMKEE